MYVVCRADDGLAVSCIRVVLTAIRTAHQLASVGFDLSQPRFRMILEGVARSRRTKLTRQAARAMLDVLAKMSATLPSPESPLGIWNRAMLLGFGAALRRSELVGFCIGDVACVLGRGLTMLVQRSKTDQHGCGASSDVSSCISAETRIARILFCGMSKAGRLSGIALSDKTVVRLAKKAAEAAGLDRERSGHLLRAELAQRSAIRARGSPTSCGDPAQMDQGRPRQHAPDDLLRSYVGAYVGT